MHGIIGDLPEMYRGMSLPEIFDNLYASMRYVHYFTGMPDPIVQTFLPGVRVTEEFSDKGEGARTYQTPDGELVERLKQMPDNTVWVTEFAVKGPNDLSKLRWLYKHMVYSFSEDNFEQGRTFLADRGEQQFWVPRSPYQAFGIQWMGLEKLVYALVDCPKEMEETMKVIDESYDQLYDEIIASGKVKIVNFGENIAQQYLTPRYFERYLVPFYEKRSNQFREAGIFTHIHIDGDFRVLLEYLKDLPFDGLEALTPLPQGDVTLEEIREHIGHKVLLDGIPAILFMSSYSPEELMEAVEQVVTLFHPRLVLGISDELPQGAEPEEAINKLQMVSDWCRDYTG